MGWRGVYMQKTLDPRLLMSRMTEGGEGEDCKCSVIPFDRLRTGVDRMRGCPQEGNQERRAVVFLPFPSFSSPL